MVPEFSPQPLSVLCLQDSVLGHNSVEDARAAMELHCIFRRFQLQPENFSCSVWDLVS